jgi:hypothetical protein
MTNNFVHKIKPLLWQILFLGISAVLFSLILINRSPNLLRPVSMSLRTGFGLVIPLTALILYLAFRTRSANRVGDLVGMAVTLSLFAMPLAGLWASGQSQSTVLNGLIPLFDAETYYMDALRLMNGSPFSIFSARRPLFGSLLAVVLTLTGRNLMVALAVLTAMTGLACYFTAREIQRTHGAEIAVFILMVLFLFYRAHSGISMSENLGVLLGTLGFGLLWRGASTKSLPYIWIGLLATTLALNARAGAFFMLPLLILWAGWLLRENRFTQSANASLPRITQIFAKPLKNPREFVKSAARGFDFISWKALFVSASAVVLGFALNLALTRLVAVPSGVPFANFSYTLYGLASGGKSWFYVFESHPELSAIREPEQSKRIYQMAFELIRSDPLQTVQGAIFNWKMLFSDSWYNIYSYLGGENWKLAVATRWGMFALCLLGIFAWARNRKDPILSLVLVAALGVFVSVPFLPPTDAYRMRPYAASIVILAALPALGLNFILSQIKRIPPAGKLLDQSLPPASAAMLTYVGVLLPILLIAPVTIQSTATPQPAQAAPCPEKLAPIMVRLDEGTYIHLKKQNAVFLDWMPDFHTGTFRENSHSLADTNMINWATNIEPPRTIFLAINYLTQQGVIAVIPTDLLPETGTLTQFCGQWETDPNLAGYSIFYGVE